MNEHGVGILQLSFDFLIYALSLPSMDPLTAIGLAGNILAFIDFGTKLVTAAYEVYESKEGATKARSFLFVMMTYFSMVVVHSIHLFLQFIFVLFST
jgi:hypothetical protein